MGVFSSTFIVRTRDDTFGLHLNVDKEVRETDSFM